MKFVAAKTGDSLHRVRKRLVSQRTGIINQIRAFLLERGVAVRRGLRFCVWNAQDPACERLMTVPAIGPIISSALAVAIADGDAFSKGRDFRAWLGLVPRRPHDPLGNISKQGNRYLRVLLVQAAWVVLIRLKSWDRHGRKQRIEAAKKRMDNARGESRCVGTGRVASLKRGLPARHRA
jgi:transposase